MRLGQALRLVQDGEEQIFRLVGRCDRHEGREQPVLRIAAADHLFGGAGFSADEIARDIRGLRAADLGVEAQKIAHALADLRPHDARYVLFGLFFRPFDEGRLDQEAAVDQRADRHHRLQRRDRQTVAEGDGHGVEFAPVPRDNRLGVLRQFGAQAIHLAHLAQEGLVAFDADHQSHARRADVRGIGEHFRHRQRAALRVIIVNREPAEMQLRPRVEARVEIDLVRLERHRDRQGLESRAHFIDADVQPVDVVRIERIDGIVRIVVGHRRIGDDLARVDVEDRRAAGLGAIMFDAFRQFVAHGLRRAQVERQRDRLQRFMRDVEARAVEIGKALAVDIFLDTGNADIVDIGKAQHMRAERTVGIDALVLGPEADAWQAEAINLFLLFWRDLALDPHETLARSELVAQFLCIQIGQDGGDEFGRLVLVDDAARLGKERDRSDVGRHDLAVAVDDLRARAGTLFDDGPAQRRRIGLEAEIDETGADHAIDHREAARDELQPQVALFDTGPEQLPAEGAHVAEQGADRGHVSGLRSTAWRPRRCAACWSVRRGQAPRACGRSHRRGPCGPAATRSNRSG